VRRFLWIHGPTIFWAALIFCLSSLPSLKLRDTGFSFQDKLAHGIEFGILGFFLLRSFNHLYGNEFKIYIFVFLVGTAYGGLDEIHQMFVQGREASMWDFIADSTGIVLSLMIFWISNKILSSE